MVWEKRFPHGENNSLDISKEIHVSGVAALCKSSSFKYNFLKVVYDALRLVFAEPFYTRCFLAK